MLHGMKTRFLLAVLLLPAAVTAATEQRIDSVYYVVAGNSVEELWADVLAKTPVEHNGQKHVAYTRWQVDWRFWWQSNGDTCDISKVETRLEVTYTLPRLHENAATPASVVDRWEDYYAALFSHEQGHKDFGVEAATEIRSRIAGMGPRETCEQLELDANAIGKSVIAEYSRVEKQYDRATNHGLNTGAVFP